ncbi:nuclear transport factor 2 family protein [Nocardioides sp.]|uniref:nuclear transport factor 2 family protein n=1 Tax=Nocardioides sp. TaxID=35761 RepID=UPI00356B2CDE
MTQHPDQAITDLLDKQAISEVLAAYARAMDRIDLDLARSVFHPEGTADYGEMFTGTGYEFADYIGAAHPLFEMTDHRIGAVTIALDGDRAGSETYAFVTLRSRAEDGSRSDMVIHGRYVDRWERRDGTWRILHRQYLHTFDEVRPVEQTMFAATGVRDQTDPSYAVLRNPVT